MLRLFTIILFLLIFAACQNQKRQENKSLIVFDLTTPKDSYKIRLSDLNVIDIDYIPLETNDSVLIGDINKIIVEDSYVYIKSPHNTILRFGKNGSFMNRIGNLGRGPKEYAYAYDFTIDPNSQDIYVFSSSDKEIYSYTSQGEFNTSFFVPQGTLSIMFADNHILCHRPYAIGNIESYLVMVDKNGNIKDNFPNYKYKVELNSRFGYINEIIWFYFNNNLFIKDIHSDTVYLFNNKQFSPQYVLNHGGKTISPEARIQFDSENKFLTIGAKYSVEIDVFRFGNYILSEFMYNDKFFFYAGDVNGNINYFGNLRHGILNDIDGGPDLKYPNFYYYDDNTIIFWIDAYELITYTKSDKFKNSTPKYPEKKKALEQLANSLDENDNPVLMLVKLKE